MPTIPNYVGMTIGDAKAARDAAGFSGGAYTGHGNGSNPGTKLVTAQSPAAGSSQSASVDQTITADCQNAWWLSSGMIIWGS